MANVIRNIAFGTQYEAALASLERTEAPDTIEYRGARDIRGVIVVVDVTAETSTPSLTVSIHGVDPISGKTWAILTSAAISTVSTTVLSVCPGIAASNNVAANAALPPIFRIVAAHGNADAITYSVSVHLVH